MVKLNHKGGSKTIGTAESTIVQNTLYVKMYFRNVDDAETAHKFFESEGMFVEFTKE